MSKGKRMSLLIKFLINEVIIIEISLSLFFFFFLQFFYNTGVGGSEFFDKSKSWCDEEFFHL